MCDSPGQAVRIQILGLSTGGFISDPALECDVKLFLSFCGLHVVFKDVISCPNCTSHFSQVFNLGDDV
jgi:hypothetical protein